MTSTRRRDRTVAAFDFDGTLTRHDSLVPFLARLVGWPRLLRALVGVAPAFAGALARRADRDDAKARLLVALLRNEPYARVADVGATYGRDLARTGLQPMMRDRVAWHRSQGHDVVIVSASLDLYLDTVGRLLDVQAVLCTRLEIDGSGRCTGRMLGGNCRGPAKATRLRDYLGAEPVEVWAYGDSAGDREMFAMADHVVRARRGRLTEGA